MYDKNIPLFPFGYGLSYTTFTYSDARVDKTSLKKGETATLTVKVTNNGSVDSDEVIQLYAQYPGSKVERPAIALKGFKRQFIPKGKTVDVNITLKADDLAYWNSDKSAFVLETGNVDLLVGSSSADIKLTTTIKTIE